MSLKSYQSTQINSASKEQILLMLYEGAISFTQRAQKALKSKDIAGKGRNITKALAIVNELMNTLDHSVGSPISKDIESLYVFTQDKLIEANLNNSIEALEAVEKILGILYKGWKEAIESLASK